jgi:hypothetical protein
MIIFRLMTAGLLLGLNSVSAEISVLDYGARPDGTNDATAAFQQALDAAGKAGGTIVSAPRGTYLFKGNLVVPPAVALKGMWESVPAHNGLRDRGLPKPGDDGTTFLVTAGKGTEEGAAFITLNHNSTLKGVLIYYPEQKSDTTPDPYPYAIAMRGKNPAVLAVELLNPYNGIDASQNERHLIRDVSGQPLRRGIFVDAIYDVGRIENVHFNPWWNTNPALFSWQQANGEAFVFGRTDWQYVLNTFCYGYKVGYKFIKTATGVCNGNFLGIGADDCNTAVLVEQCAPMGLLISNGEFVSFSGPDPTMVRIESANSGVVRFSNCAFWGPCSQIAEIAGKGTVGFGDCTFVQWDSKNAGKPALNCQGGTLLVRGCDFKANKLQVLLGEKTKKAVVSDNVVTGAVRVENKSSGQVRISNNCGD